MDKIINSIQRYHFNKYTNEITNAMNDNLISEVRDMLNHDKFDVGTYMVKSVVPGNIIIMYQGVTRARLVLNLDNKIVITRIYKDNCLIYKNIKNVLDEFKGEDEDFDDVFDERLVI